MVALPERATGEGSDPSHGMAEAAVGPRWTHPCPGATQDLRWPLRQVGTIARRHRSLTSFDLSHPRHRPLPRTLHGLMLSTHAASWCGTTFGTSPISSDAPCSLRSLATHQTIELRSPSDRPATLRPSSLGLSVSQKTPTLRMLPLIRGGARTGCPVGKPSGRSRRPVLEERWASLGGLGPRPTPLGWIGSQARIAETALSSGQAQTLSMG